MTIDPVLGETDWHGDEDVKQTLDSNIGSLMLKLENGDSNVFQALIAFLPELLERYDLKE